MHWYYNKNPGGSIFQRGVLAFYTQYRRCFSTYLTSKNVRNVTFDRRRSQRFESWTFASDPAAGSTYVTVWATTAHKQHSLMGICVSKQNKVLLTWGSAWLQVRVKYSSESILFTTRMRRRRANRLPSLPGNRRTLGDDCPTCTEWRSQAWRGCHREPSGHCTLFRFRGRRSLFWGWILTSLRCDARVDRWTKTEPKSAFCVLLISVSSEQRRQLTSVFF